MWPSIPAYRSFASIACPSAATCELPNCIFSHDALKKTTARRSPVPVTTTYDREQNAKRLKLEDDVKERVVQDVPVPAKTKPDIFVDLTKDKATPAVKNATTVKTAPSKTHPMNDTPPALPSSATRPISPPPAATMAKAVINPDAPVALLPRKLNKEPENFTKRVTLLKALHGYMKPQNDKLLKAVKPEIRALHLSANQLNKLAVDEEEKIATSNPSVYENILKQRLMKLKTMTPEVWVKERREAMAKQSGEPAKKPPPKKVHTGLTPKEEVTFLSVLKCPQEGLDAHGYVTKLPADADLTETHSALELADCWEQCDRCSTRFQVFPERREEDGMFTTGGECKYHWGKRIFPKKSRGAPAEPTRLTCCSAEVGSPGCTTHDTHVYSVKNSKRLSLIMPFIETPENEKVPEKSAVCFDCEMGYTTNGLEMLRLTAISWPQHKPLVDVLVRPLGHLLDVNTRFSGITMDQFVNAKPYDPENPKPIRKDLRIVESPYVARDLFLSHVSPQTPVVGHALENDLNTIRLIHPNIIDTVLLFPTRQGLPFRHGLRKLAKDYLEEDIQQGGAAGHDSFEDARTTGELVRFKVKEKWQLMKAEGWEIRDDGVHPPIPAEAPPKHAPSAPSMVPEAKMAVLEGAPAVKRKIEEDGTLNKLPAKKLEEE
ncbi:RNA exonuclease 3 [Pyrenophora tritici-repentis]|nr:RNA exonuclease 3 [Pyrenophora tritici-repentis]KAI0577122.1 RNA exonuclease 3 [Pyrenophora tritici-repentis]